MIQALSIGATPITYKTNNAKAKQNTPAFGAGLSLSREAVNRISLAFRESTFPNNCTRSLQELYDMIKAFPGKRMQVAFAEGSQPDQIIITVSKRGKELTPITATTKNDFSYFNKIDTLNAVIKSQLDLLANHNRSIKK